LRLNEKRFANTQRQNESTSQSHSGRAGAQKHHGVSLSCLDEVGQLVARLLLFFWIQLLNSAQELFKGICGHRIILLHPGADFSCLMLKIADFAPFRFRR
jgi:hypothetical protein